MDFEDFIMPEKQTALQQIKKLDEERAKLLESAKTDALTRAEEAIKELTELGFDYELVEPARETTRKSRTARKASAPDHHPKGTCPICEYATKPPHDKRSHRAQTRKKPFTDAELAERNLVIVA
jgi:DNA repair exonuclease SbcCD ATPase subunit